ELQFVNSDKNDYKFTGQKRDETGLDYFGARYYSNSFGRFVTPDWSATPAPVPFARLNNPQTLNLYAYVDNNPINGIDADGHSPESLVAGRDLNSILMQAIPPSSGQTASGAAGGGVTTNQDGSTTAVQIDAGQPQTQTTTAGSLTVTTTTTTVTTTTTQRDADGNVTSVKVETKADQQATVTDQKGNVVISTSQKNVPLSSRTISGKDLEKRPETTLAKLKDRPVGPDLEKVPWVGPYVKDVLEFFGVTYGTLGTKDRNNIDSGGCDHGAGPSCR